MPRSTSKANKLLRVLVVGGVALSGLTGAARAEDKAAGETQKTAKPTEKEAAKAKEAKAKEQAAKDKEKAKEKAESEGGGVKGW